MTPFSKIYDRFLAKITDDMYLELTEEETEALMEELLHTAVPLFEFPRVSLDWDCEIEDEEVPPYFVADLSNDEIDILAIYMVCAWIDQQLANVEITRMKYSGTDFKMTSQANHMAKLLLMRKDYERKGFHLQRLYKRRKTDENGIYRSTFGEIMSESTGGYKKQED